MNTLNLQAAAKFLHIHPVTLQEKARAGEIPGAKIGQQDVAKLRWLDSLMGGLLLDEITLDVIDRIKTERLKTVNKPTVNR
jgi:hypothetical protein